MSNSEDQTECPLCMESLDLDDIYFFPCTCGYQICRFCWHRIRTNENGLCPACRKLYSEDPAQFKPLADDELTKIKKERRQKETQRKQKSAESRKHLADIRVVQRNLVFVVGLSQRLSDADVLRRPEYFGKFGKIHKVVINQSTSYVGNQGPSASAYVTYFRAEDALAAIKAVNNLQIDGKTLKASLGTTKYCSHFLKGTQCQKQDCMYLHDFGDETASFTKEDIQQGKHLKYEQRLFEQLSGQSPPSNSQSESSSKFSGRTKDEPDDSSSASQSPVRQIVQQASPPAPSVNDESISPGIVDSSSPTVSRKNQLNTLQNTGVLPTVTTTLQSTPTRPSIYSAPAEHLSLFSNSGFMGRSGVRPQHSGIDEQLPVVTEIADSIPVSSCTDWQEAFGFSSTHADRDDDLGFDPWNESAKALADLIEREKATEEFHRPVTQHQSHLYQHLPPDDQRAFASRFQQNGYSRTLTDQVPQSRILNLMRHASMPVTANHSYIYPDHSFPSATRPDTGRNYPACQQQPTDVLNMREWQDELKALLPNINISFGAPVSTQPNNSYPVHHRSYLPTASLPQYGHDRNNWAKHSSFDISWDPAIINRGANILESNNVTEEPPHWMASLHHLTEERMPASHPWRHPPPGFSVARPNSDNSFSEHNLQVS